MKEHKSSRRILAMVLSIVMVLGMLPVSAAAESLPVGTSGEIISFEPLSEATAAKTVDFGTCFEDLNLPEALTATVRLASDKSEPVRNSGNSQQEEPVVDSGEPVQEDWPSDTDYVKTTVSVPVTWTASPEYDGETAGEYIFSPLLPEGFTLAGDVELPAITVMVEQTTAQISGEITAFETLSDELRWQNTATPELPETVDGTVAGEAAKIPVTWEADHDYNADSPATGLYVFTAKPQDGYTIAADVEAPRITVYIPVVKRMLLRMAGSGTSASPLEISTAAQLAEIAVLVNSGRLETFLFNDSSAKASLMLQNDLDLSAYGDGWNGGKGWVPIGMEAQPFKGSFDGGGYKITGLYLNRPSENNTGLFGYLSGGTVQNLGLERAQIVGKDFVGGVAGYVSGNSSASNCYVSGLVLSIDGCAGGVAGVVYGSVTNCYVSGAISGTNGVGGLAGMAMGSVTNCYSTGAVSGTSGVGGLAGSVSGNVTNSYATGAISGSSDFVGGVAGIVYGHVTDCAALNPSVNGNSSVGRVVGCRNVNGTLSNNAAFSGMTAPGSEGFGAIADDLTDKNGATITADAIIADGSIGSRFAALNGWTITAGKLPILTNAGGTQTGDLPPHLANDTTPPYFLGGGTAPNPYQIGTAAQLAKLAELVNAGDTDYNDKYYKLTADLDLAAYGVDWNGGKGWVPIGNQAQPFKGTFDGNGKIITGLYIYSREGYNFGLFGAINGGTVQSLGLEEANITGGGAVGTVAGYVSGGEIKNCYATGAVYGTGNHVGGVAGYVGGSVINCYATGAVQGEAYNVGGVAGYVTGTVTNCYATGAVRGRGCVGGVAGITQSGSVTNCAALNPSISGTSSVGRVVGSPNGTLSNNAAFSGMTDPGTAKFGAIANSATDKNGATISADAIIADGRMGNRFTASGGWTVIVGKLPVLTNVGGMQTGNLPPHFENGTTIPYFLGAGTEVAPYQISTSAQLARLAELVNAGNSNYNDKFYKLTDDIDLSPYGRNWNGGKGWVPIGNYEKQFKGVFDGNNHKITGLYINRPAEIYIGLFGYINDGTVQNFGLEEVSITAGHDAGGVGGYIANGRIKNCYLVGTVTGANEVGGIVGWVYSGGSVTNCYATGAISGEESVGGVAGYVTENCYVTNSYSTGAISGWINVGGMAGYVGGSVINCYATSAVSGRTNVGGVAGLVGGSMNNCAALSPSVSGNSSVGRVAGDSSDTLSGNAAFIGMTAPGTGKFGIIANSATDINGLNLSSTQMATASFWTTASNWDTSGWDETVWTFENGKLPILKNVGGTQSGAGGLYLTARDIAHAALTGTYTYTGNLIIPTLQITFDGQLLEQGVDYTVAVTSVDGTGTSAGTNPGTVTLTLTGTGNFTGTKSGVTFEIEKASQASPSAFTLTYETVNNANYTVTILATVGAEYSFDGTTWSSTNTKTGCQPGDTITGYKRIAAKLGYNASPFTSNSVTLPSQAEMPTAEPNGGNFASNQSVTLSCKTAGAQIYYTTDGSTPTASSTLYSASFTLTATATVKAIAVKTGMINSRVLSVTFTRQSSGTGGGGGSSSFDTDTTTAIKPEKQPNQPVTVTTTVTATAGIDGMASIVIPNQTISDAIAKALAYAKAQSKAANGIGISLTLNNPVDTKSLSIVLTRSVLQQLTDADVKLFEVDGQLLSLSFNQAALQEILRQSTGDVTTSLKPVNVSGIRNAYNITIGYVKDGKTVSITSLGSGSAMIGVPYTTAKGEALGGLYAVYVDAKGNATRIPGSAYDTNSRCMIFITNHFSVYGVGYTAPTAKFTDVSSHWGKESIGYVVGRGLLSGTSDTAFSPNNPMTRGMLVTALGKLESVDTKVYTGGSFTDVKSDSAYHPYIEWAYSKGVVQGIGNNQFAPDRAITREEIAVIFANYAKATSYTLPVTREATTYADASSTGSAYKDAVKAMQQAGIMMGGSGNNFNPKANATRAEVSSMLQRYIKLTIDPATAQGWVKNDAGQYLYYKNGKFLTSTQTIDGVKYFFGTDGTLKTGWVKDGDNWRYYSGKTMLVGFWDVDANGNNKTSYFTKDGLMVSGKWLEIEGKWYYFNADGSLAKSTKIDGYEVDENGVRKVK